MAQVTSFQFELEPIIQNDGEFEAYLVRPGETALSTSSMEIMPIPSQQEFSLFSC
ncbi:MAG: hypothetical protein IPP27_18765 [Bacteroidetes bacterium]|nr:hypothetical protein [Bacteroidota bacterium]